MSQDTFEENIMGDSPTSARDLESARDSVDFPKDDSGDMITHPFDDSANHQETSISLSTSKTLSKKDAKATLSKKEYKLWKKENKKRKGDAKSKKDKNKKKKRERDSDIEDDAFAGYDNQTIDEAEHQGIKRRRRERAMKRILSDEGLRKPKKAEKVEKAPEAVNGNLESKKPSKDKWEEQRKELAALYVNQMTKARKADVDALKKSQVPVERLLLRKEVEAFARVSINHETLVKAGFLKEIAYWLINPGTSDDLAPLDLRNTALGLLIDFEYYGSTGHRNSSNEDTWEGIEREHIENTNLGKAINIVRKSPKELPKNRKIACMLLERLSRAWSCISVDEQDENRGEQYSSGDPDVLPPSTVLVSASEAFQKAVVKVDPHDPRSYLRVPPLRLKKVEFSQHLNST